MTHWQPIPVTTPATPYTLMAYRVITRHRGLTAERLSLPYTLRMLINRAESGQDVPVWFNRFQARFKTCFAQTHTKTPLALPAPRVAALLPSVAASCQRLEMRNAA